MNIYKECMKFTNATAWKNSKEHLLKKLDHPGLNPGSPTY